jgi:ribonuclease HI
LRDKIRQLKLTGRRNEFFWIPAHCGVQTNEKADSGAKDAINNGKDSQFLHPSLDMKAYWKGCIQV